MPTLVILATSDDSLAGSWEQQLLPGRIVLRLATQDSPVGGGSSFAAVVVLDAAFERMLPSSLSRCPAIYIGEPRSLPFEQAKMAGRAKVYLSYEESAVRLRELIPLLEEVAEKQLMVESLQRRDARGDYLPPLPRNRAIEQGELWDFLECAIESIDDRERVVLEFRRAARQLLHASHVVFFLRSPDGYRADRGTSFFPSDDPLVDWLERNPVIVDDVNWSGPADPVSELAVRNRLALWGARMLVPIHDNGRLLGLVACGVRDDGHGYDEVDRTRAILLARLFRQFLIKSAQISRLEASAEKAIVGARYLPGSLVLEPGENPPRHVPLVVRDLIGRSRQTKDVCRVQPTFGQPFRASAGLISENGGIWAWWQESLDEVHDAERAERASRRLILRELALTLSHELGNSLVSLATFRQSNRDRPLPNALIESIKADVVNLELLNNNLSVMQRLHEAESCYIDIRDLAQRVGLLLGVSVEIGPDPVAVCGSEELLEYALRALLAAIIERRLDASKSDLVVKVRSAGSPNNLTALISIRGRSMELEGVMPEPLPSDAPSHGRIAVFLAKEIVLMHQGEIHSGPGMEATEVLLSIRDMK